MTVREQQIRVLDTFARDNPGELPTVMTGDFNCTPDALVHQFLTGRASLQGEGTYDGTTAQIRYRVVEATGELAGLTGSGTSRSTHADYPYMPLVLEYDLG